MADARGMHPTAVEVTSNYTKRFDIQATVIYIGYASHSSASNTASWQIKKITLSGGLPTALQFADSNEAFDNVWDDRATLTYG